MRPKTSHREERVLHGRGNASVALGVAVLLLVMDFVPLHRTVNSEPSWIREIVTPLSIVAMGAVIWRTRSLWESSFLGIFVADISLKGLLPVATRSVFRSTVSPFLWGAAAAIAAGLLISSLKVKP